MTSRVNDFKYVLSFFFACLFCFTVLLVSILYVPRINHMVSLLFFFSFLSVHG